VTPARSLVPHLGRAFTHPSEAMNSILKLRQTHHPNGRRVPVLLCGLESLVFAVTQEVHGKWQNCAPMSERMKTGRHG
jgi:hypothetical protein